MSVLGLVVVTNLATALWSAAFAYRAGRRAFAARVAEHVEAGWTTAHAVSYEADRTENRPPQ